MIRELISPRTHMTMVALSMKDSSKKYFLTPIGPIPTDFSAMDELLKKAFIGFRDTKVFEKAEDGDRVVPQENGTARIERKFKDVPRIVRDWFIVQDEEKVMHQRQNTGGNWVRDENRMMTACNEHQKFCMILDYIRHVVERSETEVDQDKVLMIAIGKLTTYETAAGGSIDLGEAVKRMREMHWRNVRNQIVKAGVPGYTAVNDPDDL